MRWPKWPPILFRNRRRLLIVLAAVVALVLAARMYAHWNVKMRVTGLVPSRFKLESYQDAELIQFLTAEEIAVLLTTDADDYVKSLSPADLAARGGVRTADDYLAAIKGLGVTLDPPRKRALTRAAMDVDGWLSAAAQRSRTVHGVQFAKLRILPWKIAVVAAPAPGAPAVAYEANLPHTRGDVIFIPASYIPAAADADAATDRRLATTLLHEKIHVYQKAYPTDIADALTAEGYTRHKLRSADPRARANPDLDQWIYKDPKGAVMTATYTSDAPTSITDVTQTHAAAFEHPYERIAYTIAAMYSV